MLSAGIGAAPLALLTDDAEPRLPELVSQFAERVAKESPDQDTENLLLSCSYILLGLRYDKDVIRSLFSGVQKIRESSTYQAILDEGREEGLREGRNEAIIQGEQVAIITFLQERFGAVPPEVETRVRATTDPTRLQAAIRQVLQIDAPGDLQL